MGTHGHGPVMHALMGNVAERVVRTAPCPVLAVREPLEKTSVLICRVRLKILNHLGRPQEASGAREIRAARKRISYLARRSPVGGRIARSARRRAPHHQNLKPGRRCDSSAAPSGAFRSRLRRLRLRSPSADTPVARWSRRSGRGGIERRRPERVDRVPGRRIPMAAGRRRRPRPASQRS
jgi:hypothetical protein